MPRLINVWSDALSAMEIAVIIIPIPSADGQKQINLGIMQGRSFERRLKAYSKAKTKKLNGGTSIIAKGL